MLVDRLSAYAYKTDENGVLYVGSCVDASRAQPSLDTRLLSGGLLVRPESSSNGVVAKGIVARIAGFFFPTLHAACLAAHVAVYPSVVNATEVINRAPAAVVCAAATLGFSDARGVAQIVRALTIAAALKVATRTDPGRHSAADSTQPTHSSSEDAP
jgi:hypothetical protein